MNIRRPLDALGIQLVSADLPEHPDCPASSPSETRPSAPLSARNVCAALGPQPLPKDISA
ncbi:hypothetical protein ACFYQ5_16025 [Streptomyces sp. NPDC005794]|uniref:hypothetical protein n=1 Tax=Streptomyces sp. NPDC005794 TaxID=3364733 RepID=UPI00369A7AB6